MNIVKKTNGNELTIALEGRLDTTTSPQLENELRTALNGVAEFVLDLLLENGLSAEKNPSYRSTRPAAHAFREASIEEKNAIIAKDPAFGRIVCRCETVTEGEILAAIRQNPKPRDLDGIKRRTRAQMGRCQGGFCSPTIVELLSRELGIPFEQVTKFGGGSYLNVGKTKEDV